MATYDETGHVIHGYVSGATVFHDTNRDGALSSGEVSAITDALGQYFLQSAPGPLVSIGGTDTSTNLPITLPLQAPEGSTVITPLTTLVSLLLPTNPTASDIAAATSTVTGSLGISLSAGQSLLTLDTVAGTLSGNPGATDAYLTAAKVYDTISILSAGLSNQGGVSAEAARSGVTAAIADKLKAGQPLDLGNPAALREVLTSAAAAAGTTVNTSAVTSIANIAVASNVAMDNVVAGATSGQAIFAASSTVQHVAEGATTSALQNLPANQPVSSVEAQYSNPVAVGAGTGDNTLVVRVSGDHYQGDPQFQVYVDGKAVGNPQYVTAVHTQGQWQDITLKGDFSPTSAHNVEVRFLNDAYDGSFNFSEGHDKNLYVSSITLDGNKFGATDANPAALLSNGGTHFATAPVQTPGTGGTGGSTGGTGGSTGGTGGSTGGTGGSTGGTGNTGTGDNTLVVRVSGDHYQGDPQFQVYVDGKAVGDPQSVPAVHTQGQWQDITLNGDCSPTSAHNVEVRFLNDAYDGSFNFTGGHDKNLYVSSITLDGNKFGATDANPAVQLSNGGINFTTAPVQTPTTGGTGGTGGSTGGTGGSTGGTGGSTGGTGTGDNTLVVRVSGDHYQGDPQFQVYVDGKAVGDPQSVTAVHTQGQWQDITLKGDFSPTSAHNVEVRFLNDAYDGSFNFTEEHDRTLYRGRVCLYGKNLGATDANTTVQLSNGGINFTTAPVQTPTTV
ncbi:hypothetical protein MKK84_11195 [Methylobacterium sp. E-065]|uniref:carbohydrate-binding domain-containing protein n=1 Tax=Methylobacterium sp. E-065 TaxID=2836583 RepID=UPI001FBA33E6|nr:carbohydrate-binding domain-containing protein [Methylobacterium sp. E-065]MCJ2017985.1 hypothetical protein [Methylobacterium sp. E-065]